MRNKRCLHYMWRGSGKGREKTKKTNTTDNCSMCLPVSRIPRCDEPILVPISKRHCHAIELREKGGPVLVCMCRTQRVTRLSSLLILFRKAGSTWEPGAAHPQPEQRSRRPDLVSFSAEAEVVASSYPAIPPRRQWCRGATELGQHRWTMPQSWNYRPYRCSFCPRIHRPCRTPRISGPNCWPC